MRGLSKTSPTALAAPNANMTDSTCTGSVAGHNISLCDDAAAARTVRMGTPNFNNTQNKTKKTAAIRRNIMACVTVRSCVVSGGDESVFAVSALTPPRRERSRFINTPFSAEAPYNAAKIIVQHPTSHTAMPLGSMYGLGRSSSWAASGDCADKARSQMARPASRGTYATGIVTLCANDAIPPIVM